MKPINAEKLIKILRKHGFIVSRQKGSHMIWKNLATNTIVPVPLHGKSKPIPIGTLLAIIKQSKISKEEFKP
ncbi:MAG: hypothetical protein A2934_01050 [Candidatus Sungbacteria bacterium RIFCSPLOWO2_01_FULL_47_10]|uniref:Addiction module toxin, HicA family n=1 Tax=Candidatus Sungbacteria bacterium RIFCSPLOWO2_01_FULL_47_10 TaxID=1802276 RepID=A0A1G2L4P5_9BACT|nr:MAG: hypothetical protein A2934_01050 [Candidatus Sungbacteria bacterium RIFCSPLOWO2_01_FULL_47_10]